VFCFQPFYGDNRGATSLFALRVELLARMADPSRPSLLAVSFLNHNHSVTGSARRDSSAPVLTD
jgi:hypothetical protein